MDKKNQPVLLEDIPKLCEVLEVEPFQLFLTNETSGEIADDWRRERVLTRLKTCNREELDLLCDVLTKFIER